jgi:hypothetical protein
MLCNDGADFSREEYRDWGQKGFMLGFQYSQQGCPGWQSIRDICFSMSYLSATAFHSLLPANIIPVRKLGMAIGVGYGYARLFMLFLPPSIYLPSF